jgi:hypothetical protein
VEKGKYFPKEANMVKLICHEMLIGEKEETCGEAFLVRLLDEL